MAVAHERRRARRRRDGGERAGEERPREAGATGQRLARARPAAAEDDHARQAERHHEQHVGEQGDEDRRLELEAPADLLAAGPEAEQRPRYDRERDEHARRVGQSVPAQRDRSAWWTRPSAFTESTGSTHGMRLSTRPPARASAIATSERRGRPLGRPRLRAHGSAVRESTPSRRSVTHQHALDRPCHRLRQRAARHREREAVGGGAHLLRRGVLDHAPARRIEPRLGQTFGVRPGAATESVTVSAVTANEAGHGLGGRHRPARGGDQRRRREGPACGGPAATGRSSATGASSGTQSSRRRPSWPGRAA